MILVIYFILHVILKKQTIISVLKNIKHRNSDRSFYSYIVLYFSQKIFKQNEKLTSLLKFFFYWWIINFLVILFIFQLTNPFLSTYPSFNLTFFIINSYDRFWNLLYYTVIKFLLFNFNIFKAICNISSNLALLSSYLSFFFRSN